MVAYLLCSLIYDLDNRISAEVRRRLNSYTRIDHSSFLRGCSLKPC